MARPYWSGNIQISLVSFGVSLYVATESKSQISFHQISRSTGERIRHQKVLQSAAESQEATTAVGNDEIVKGYEYSKGKYVIIEPSELENLRIPSKHTIAVSQFINVSELNPEYVEKPYFVTPENDMQAEAFNVVRQALRNSGKAAVGKVSFAGRESIVAVLPAPGDDRGMMAYTLRYKNELRDQTEYFRDIKQPPINADSLQLAETLITKMSAKLDMGKFEDGYEVAVKALVEAKIKNMPLPVDTAPKQQPGNVINLMDALRKSVGADSRTAKKPPKSEKEALAKSIRLVKGQAKASPKRKSA
ncbi:Ku protein [Telmatobacter sp. DSM 110680]|uniref:Non-homologous end joining protein Ku n=1 Tax=Telmatobacter sp. DSM 110680 TaxID=3036704 RepID=A0AAU7DGB3_9BACT